MGPNEIHVWSWLLDLEAESIKSEAVSYLTKSEKARADNFRFSSDASRYLLSHYMLRLLIEFYAGSECASREFTINQYGKPSIENSVFEFNLSHSGNVAVVAFSVNIPVGVDVEAKRSDFDYIAIGKHFFTSEESSHIESDKNPEDRFFQYWTGKEAIAKAIGQGLSIDLKSFSLQRESSKSPTVTWTDPSGVPLRFKLVELSMCKAYSAALAYKAGHQEITLMHGDFTSFLNKREGALGGVGSVPKNAKK